MKITQFDAPGNNGDFAGNLALAAKWSTQMSQYFDQGVSDGSQALTASGGGTPQFYNPLMHGLSSPDVTPPSAGNITWNGFPRRFLGTTLGAGPNFAAAEPTPTAGHPRNQDEYLEWHVTRNNAGKIASVQFTCEGYDYYEFLGAEAPDILLRLYQKFISPSVDHNDLFSGGKYQKSNRWNTAEGAMHLTEPANNLFAEVSLAAQATVRRKDNTGHEITSAVPLTRCAGFGNEKRNSDPAIGAGVNAFARQGRLITRWLIPLVCTSITSMTADFGCPAICRSPFGSGSSAGAPDTRSGLSSRLRPARHSPSRMSRSPAFRFNSAAKSRRTSPCG